MQCNEVIRELAAPSDDRDPAALAEHLAGCATCAEWAKQASWLDRVWEVTRPPDPSPQVWDNMWVHVVESLDSPSSVRIEHPGAIAASRNGSTPHVAPFAAQPSLTSRTRPWSLAAIASFGLVQAASVLLAVGLVWHSFPAAQDIQTAKRPDPSTAVHSYTDADLPCIEIEEGNLVVIRSEGQKAEVLVVTSESFPFGIDDSLLILNAAESIAPNPIVAMKE